MADEVYKQSRRKITPDEVRSAGQGPMEEGSPMDSIKQMQDVLAKETGREPPRNFTPQEAPFEISGNIPPEFRKAMMQHQQMAQEHKTKQQSDDVVRKQTDEDDNFEVFEAPPERPAKPKQKPVPDSKVRVTGSDPFEDALKKLSGFQHWEDFEFPSKGKFYADIPGVIHIRAMTGEEEQILATPRWVKRGKAIDMIFNRCIKEPINTEDLLSVDRTNLLIFLRGISYTPEYDVEIKCPNCGIKFAHVIELSEMNVELCPEEFDMNSLSGVLPKTGFRYSYRLATGQDEQEISMYREQRINKWGDQSDDDTLLYRTALLLEEVEGVTMKKELALLLKKLPIQDVAHLRNEINKPPFGVDTELPIMCPNCMEDFKIDLPMETNFFFPKKREERSQA